jgi:hypothetical protein
MSPGLLPMARRDTGTPGRVKPLTGLRTLGLPVKSTRETNTAVSYKEKGRLPRKKARKERNSKAEKAEETN